MIKAYNDWLPRGALQDGALEAFLTEHLSMWSQSWFGAACECSVNGDAKVDSFEEASSAYWASGSEDLSVIVATSEAAHKIGRHLLKVGSDEKTLSQNDLIFVSALSAKSGKDLRNKIIELLESLTHSNVLPSNHDECPNYENGIFYKLCISGTDAEYGVFLSSSFAALFRKAILPKHIVSKRPQSVSDLALEQDVIIGAKIGTANIQYRELKELSEGDVIVLNSALTNQIPVRINNVCARDFSCKVISNDDIDALKLSQFQQGK